jgi:hypothetical protein
MTRLTLLLSAVLSAALWTVLVAVVFWGWPA